MLDTFIRDISARWGLGDQGRPLVQMLVAHISNPAIGGLPGFLDKFRKAGWGGMVNTWVDNSSNAEVPTTAQVEAVLGTGDGFLDRAAARLGISYDKVSAAVAGILPLLVGRMTPDGTVPAVLPTEFNDMAREGKALLGAAAGGATAAAYGTARTTTHVPPAAHATAVPQSSGGFGKWLPWLIAALVVIFGVSYCNRTSEPESSPPAADVSPVTPMEPAPTAPAVDPAAPATDTTTPPALGEPATSTDVPSSMGTDTPAPLPGVPGSSTDAPASSINAPASSTDAPATSTNMSSTGSGGAGINVTAPDGAGVLDDMHNGMPVLRVFFDTGKTEVDSAFAEKSKSLVEFMNANRDVTAVISGFNDPTGDAARNAELSKERAEAVKAALESAGLAPERAVLEKPAETTDTSASNAASRRVDVMLRR